MKTIIATSAIILISGCTSIMQKNKFDSFDADMVQANYQNASVVALNYAGFNQDEQQIDDLFWGMQAGAVLNYSGNYAFSTQVLDLAEAMMKTEDQEGVVKNVSETLGSIAGNDAMLDYEQTQLDGVMVNTIKAWNFIFDEDYNNARVELNRAEERQRRAVEYFANKIKAREDEIAKESGSSQVLVNKSVNSTQTQQTLLKAGYQQNQWQPYEGYVNPFTTYSYALNLMLTGKNRSDFQKAADSFKRVYEMTNSQTALKDFELARTLASQQGSNALDNKVWVIFENGQSIVKEEKRLDLPVFLASDNVLYTGVALPALKARGTAYSNIAVNTVKTENIASMDRIIGAEFDHDFPFILAREIARVTVKTIAQKQLNDQSASLGRIAAIYQLVTTGADTRSFSALPAEYQITRVDAKDGAVTIQAGQHTIPVSLESGAKNHIVYVKAISETAVPTVRVSSI